MLLCYYFLNYEYIIISTEYSVLKFLKNFGRFSEYIQIFFKIFESLYFQIIPKS